MGAPAEAFKTGSAFRGDALYAGARLPHLVGENDARFPAGNPLVLDLELSPEEFIQWARRPASDWWPLLETLRRRGCFLRVPLASKGSTVSAVRRLARLEPRANFLVDPFLHGPTSNWAAHVRLAETPRIFLTLLGAFADDVEGSAATAWSAGKLLPTVLHFVTGEVGAGKLFFASGRASSTPPDEAHVEKWLTSLGALDKDQVRLIRCDNAREMFGGAE